ncbi:MAG: TIGR00159 family protein [Spirochaetaceae bacterium]|nr:TIGR00159 family protein [Spirochaetaceae bacterium]
MEGFDKLLAVYDSIRPIIDISLLVFFLYKIYDVVAKTQGMQIVRTAIIIGVAYACAIFFQLSTVLWLLNIFAPVILIVFAIVFQPELRKIFIKIGQGNFFKPNSRSRHSHIDSVIEAAKQLSELKRGMLVVFCRRTNLDELMKSGTTLNADLSSTLLFTIFSHDTPLHDGATFVYGGKILAAGCFLPLSDQFDIKKTFGTRHRAALGVTEQSDAVVLIVSEETGAISLAYDSKLYYDLSTEQIRKTLEIQLELSNDPTSEEGIDEQNQS